MGLYNRLHWEQGIEGWCLFLLTRFLGWQHEEVTVYVAQMRKMLRDKTVHAYHDVYVALHAFILKFAQANGHLSSVVYGRKPIR